ncbi:MAG: 30S ribosomal protein S15 [Candidatus Jacksonbacteria bacterium RIFOXYA2_FULL_44_7]|uniref:Small ribosomal subunit protein uS15 n=1 Tax=Candidatus Jacksonbacteria bacterium RIFCSPLOWO2_02_FULL_44_20 TaxID=1798460 RepID=A0A1G2A6S8_9BACT|nr:MAG: 30S ribosomal protein S15 [Parcubacteria group bacterium GW2011_GWC2_44_17]KKT50140.1 MAG: 30S ribosomal protein S15 [Parcubacteria group bacterium GW2011_GWF2_44_17]OGY69897.1 MAG: 30S ribosomal protein S15 [Candidatus Jacksonbacteria bacterium RIFCSPHIGHO2_02_FULL_44_25]OGY71909.1 MAG: 30S ribosomal protein S15 [Candidatus Jacksonbacteria bacterium RIFCSPHIGHO2_12_FULL_44_12]OGY72379.1 MAG: 30S ribosomal protein S15 [Candidatus Jacksonbacteria bacterium RIFCSPLOWO2_02_FULL_44_20]OGY7
MLPKKIKDNVISQFKMHQNDTGSASVQIALLTKEIELLTEHLRSHKKDFSSRRGLIKKVSQRRRLLKFLEKDDFKQFEEIIKTLKLRRPAKITAIDEDIAREEKLLAEEQAKEVLVEVKKDE